MTSCRAARVVGSSARAREAVVDVDAEARPERGLERLAEVRSGPKHEPEALVGQDLAGGRHAMRRRDEVVGDGPKRGSLLVGERRRPPGRFRRRRSPASRRSGRSGRPSGPDRPSSHRHLLLEAGLDHVVGGAQRDGHDRRGRVDTGRRDEARAVDDVQVLDVVSCGSSGRARTWPGRRPSARCPAGASRSSASVGRPRSCRHRRHPSTPSPARCGSRASGASCPTSGSGPRAPGCRTSR